MLKVNKKGLFKLNRNKKRKNNFLSYQSKNIKKFTYQAKSQNQAQCNLNFILDLIDQDQEIRIDKDENKFVRKEVKAKAKVLNSNMIDNILK